MFVTIAQAAPPPLPNPIVALFCPWFFFGVIFGVILGFMARRKGRNPFLWFAIGLIPVAGIFAAFVLASRPDIDLLERLWALEEKLEKTVPNPKPPELPPDSTAGA